MNNALGTAHLYEYVKLQRDLVGATNSQYGDDQRGFSTDEVTKTGEVEASGTTWRFQRHGSGIIFTNAETGVKVDVDEWSVDSGCFDAWRLRTYLGSLGRRGVKLVSFATGESGINLEDNINTWLSKLLSDGAISEVNGYYKLTE